MDWMTSPYWDGSRIRTRRKGVPQGSPVSPLLANLFLQSLDRSLSAADTHMVRYADDFVVLALTAQAAEAALHHISELLRSMNLQLHAQKTAITNFGEGLRFLGAFFSKDEIWQPWKEQARQQGRVLAMAKPMPAHLLDRYQATPVAIAPKAKPFARIPLTLARQEITDMAYLYLTEQGSVLRKSGDRLLVELEQKIVLDVPYNKLEHVLVFGHIQVTTQAIHELLEKGVDLSYFTRSGQFRGSLTPPRSTNVQDRLSQLEVWRDDKSA